MAKNLKQHAPSMGSHEIEVTMIDRELNLNRAKESQTWFHSVKFGLHYSLEF